MKYPRLHRANSCIRQRNAKTAIKYKQRVIGKVNRMAPMRIAVMGCFCPTLPNAFKQCAITLRIIHSALIEGEAKKPPEGGMNDRSQKRRTV